MKPTARTSHAPFGNRGAARTAGQQRSAPGRVLLWSLLLVLAACLQWQPARAQTQADGSDIDPPGRVARLNLAEGPLSFAPPGSTQWSAAPYNRPLTDGDRLWTAQGSRAEIDTGDALLRLDGSTHLLLQEVDDEQVKLQLLQGTLALRLADLAQGDRYEVDTPNLAFVANRSGDYRIDVDLSHGVTQVTVLSGNAVLYGDGGQATELRAGQRLAFQGRTLAALQTATAGGASDAFDQWVATRDRALDQSVTARYVSPGTVGYQQLDQYGSWQTSGEYGSVWYPSSVPANWAPYRYGQWNYIEPWGWTWVDDAPWGFAPFHYGRWIQSGSRWGWAPGAQVRRATYAPALVAFGGNGGGDVHWRPGRSSQWFPLAPGEAWRPGYQASDRYIDRVNRGIQGGGGRNGAPDRYTYAGRPGAFTSIDRNDWEQRRPVRGVPIDTGFDTPHRAPFALPAVPLPKPQAFEQPGYARSTHDWSVRRGANGDVLVPSAGTAIAPIRNAQPMPKPQVFEVDRLSQIDWQRRQQAQQEQAPRAQYQDRQQERIFDQQRRQQQQQGQRYQLEQQQRVQADQQRQQFEQQQRVQADQQRRHQSDQWQQRQQQMQQQQQQQQQMQQRQQQYQPQIQQQQNRVQERRLQQQ
ncbi:MAG: DUF6600 domain-containing protein, partial [Burkholderiales bacterium]